MMKSNLRLPSLLLFILASLPSGGAMAHPHPPGKDHTACGTCRHTHELGKTLCSTSGSCTTSDGKPGRCVQRTHHCLCEPRIPKSSNSLVEVPDTIPGLRQLQTQDQRYRVALPDDLQQGDVVSLTVFKDDQPTTEKLTVSISSIATFTDDEAETETEIAIPAQGEGLYSTTVPEDPKPSTDNSAIETVVRLLIKDDAGRIVAEGETQVKDRGFYPTPTQFGFPTEVTSGQAARITGPFKENVDQTQVNIDGQATPILAKSPRGVIVDPPSSLGIGNHEWVVQEGSQIATAVVNHAPGNAPPPAGATSPEPLDETIPTEPSSIPTPTPGNAPPPAGTTSPEPLDETIPTGTQPSTLDCETAVSNYRTEMTGRIDTGWKPPKPPNYGEWVTKLRYDLTQTGELTNIEVVKSSGFPPQDQSAIERVSSMRSYFKPLPDCYKGSSLEIDHIFKVIFTP